MKVPALKPNIRTMTILAIVAALLFFAGILTYVVCTRHLKVASAELQEKQKQVEDSKKIANRLLDVQERYLRTQEEISFLETSVSTQSYVPTLLKQIEALGTSVDLRVNSVRPMKAPPAAPPPIKRTSEDPEAAPASGSTSNVPADGAEEPKPYQELNIDIELEGTYWHARDFIYRLTSFPKIISVKEMQVSPAGPVEGRKSPKLLVKLTVTAFVFQEKSESDTKQTPSTPPTTNAAATERRLGHEG